MFGRPQGNSEGMTSPWLDRSTPVPDDVLPSGPVDDLVVGAGLTGLTTAVLLARAGRRVAVVEARSVGAVTTGNSTAKLSLLQGTHLSRVLRRQPRQTAEAHVDASREGMEWLLRFCADHDVPVQRRPAVTFAGAESERRAVTDEHEAARALGLDVRWQDRLDVPFPTFGATVLDDQAQFDPVDVLTALVRQLRAHGGTLHQGHRVRSLSRSTHHGVRLADGTELVADQVVLATGTPILDRGLWFARLEPQRSYGLAFRGTVPPVGMFLSAGADARSVRDAAYADGPLLLVGGSGHTVGRTHSEREHVDRLREWTRTHFPGAIESHAWSAQDYRAHDGVPHFGTLVGAGGRVHVATGFEKWGMTNAVVAAHAISGRILGSSPPWAGSLDRRPQPSDVQEIARMNAGVALALAAGGARAAARHLPGRSRRTDAESCGVVGVCTHLGGVLRWNDQEGSWDCPLHGSRFTADGEVLEGPATRPLIRRTGREGGHDASRFGD